MMLAEGDDFDLLEKYESLIYEMRLVEMPGVLNELRSTPHTTISLCETIHDNDGVLLGIIPWRNDDRMKVYYHDDGTSWGSRDDALTEMLDDVSWVVSAMLKPVLNQYGDECASATHSVVAITRALFEEIGAA